jgi:hypothetical protein
VLPKVLLSRPERTEWGNRAPVDVFNRLMAKHVKSAGWTPNTHTNIRPEQVRSRREQWGVETLGQLRRDHQGVAGPRTRLDGPIVIVEYEGALRLLDGNHSINTWAAKGDLALHCMMCTFTRSTGRDSWSSYRRSASRFGVHYWLQSSKGYSRRPEGGGLESRVRRRCA